MIDITQGPPPTLNPMRAIKHLSACIAVSNLEETAEWYRQELGFEMIQSRDFPEYSSRIAYLRTNSLQIELVEDSRYVPAQRPDPPNHTMLQGVSQISFLVDNLDDIVEWVESRPIMIAFGPVTVADLGVKACFIRDNEGNLIEFIEVCDT